MPSDSKLTTFFVGLLLMLLMWPSGGVASSGAVICNSNTSIAEGEVVEIYKGIKRFSESQRLLLTDNVEAQEEFIRNLLELDLGSYHSIWEKLTFQDGVVPPKRISNDREVLEFVENHPGAIGYIHADANGEWKKKVKVVREF